MSRQLADKMESLVTQLLLKMKCKLNNIYEEV